MEELDSLRCLPWECHRKWTVEDTFLCQNFVACAGNDFDMLVSMSECRHFYSPCERRQQSIPAYKRVWVEQE